MRTAFVPDVVVRASGRCETGRAVVVDGGAIVDVCAREHVNGAVVVEKRGHAMFPGFTNAHSHAFQRALRGRVERRDPRRPHDDFWSWRDAMYTLASGLRIAEFEAVSTLAFAEMRAAGFTSVVEFHYVHRAADDDDPLTSARAISRAAARTGIRLTLLLTAYERAGFNVDVVDAQRGFLFATADAFLAHVDAVRELAFPDVNVGVAVHSVRAVSRPFLEGVVDGTRARDLLLHVHAAEQRAELRACQTEHGMSPIALLDDVGALSPRTSLVHATHISDDDVARIARGGSTVVLCPTTERNLGDGLCPISSLVDAGVPLAIGTDSHARIDPWEEMRALEDHERLRTEQRAKLIVAGGTLATAIVPAATTGGARASATSSTRAPVGDLAIGAPADFLFAALPADAPDAESAVDATLLTAGPRSTRDVFVGGRSRGDLDDDGVLALAHDVKRAIQRLSSSA